MVEMSSTSRFKAVFRSPLGISALVGVSVVVGVAAVGPLIWGEVSTATDLMALSAKPSSEHWFGTDAAGRDVLARVMTAARLSVVMAFCATTIGVVLGVLFGFLPTVLPARTAAFVTSSTGIALAFPALLLTIVFSISIGANATGAVLAIGFAMVPANARLAQTMSASVAGRDFISAATILGVSRTKILLRHILPNVREPLIVNASISAGGSLIAFAGLSFLGLGVQAPDADWGRLLNEGLSKIYVNPATALAPAAAVIVAGLVFTLLGETLARAYGIDSMIGRRPRYSEPTDLIEIVGDVEVGDEIVLRVRNLVVSAPRGDNWNELVKGVSFDIRRGEIVGIVGESGSGKSLTCMAVAGLLEDPLTVTCDSVRFDGTELSQNGRVPNKTRSARVAHQLGTRLAMVFQDPSTSLNPAVKVGPQVAESAILHQKLNRRTALARAVERLAAVRISDPERRANQYPHEFSGGMRQRAMIAMGLMGAPALIVADEPTTALDVTVQREVLTLLQSINQQEESAILLVSHDIAVVTALCSRLLVMYRGCIVEDIAVVDLVAGAARHPYTRALLDAVPNMDAVPGSAFATISDDAVFEFEPEAVLA